MSDTPRDEEERWWLNVYDAANEQEVIGKRGPFATEEEARGAFADEMWQPGTVVILWLFTWHDHEGGGWVDHLMEKWTV